MTAVALRDRVQRILASPNREEEERVHLAIDEVAAEVGRVTRRLALIDPEWELVARQPLEPLEGQGQR